MALLDYDPLFEIDASKVLAKLHLAARMPLSLNKGEFIVNSGITDDDVRVKVDPNNIKKTRFDLSNEQHQYEVGFVTEIKYDRSIGVESILQKLASYDSQLQNLEGDKETEGMSASERRKLKDDIQAKTQKIKINIDKLLNDIQTKHIIHKLGLTPPSTTDLDHKKINKFLMDISDKKDDLETDEIVADKNRNARLSEARTHACEQLQKYFNVFVGSVNVEKIEESKLIQINISENIQDQNDPELVKNFEIIEMKDVEKSVMTKKFQTNKKNCVERICFKVGYTITID